MSYLNEYFSVSEGKTPVVELDNALNDDRIIEAFVPVKSTLDVFSFLQDVSDLHNPNSRAVLCHGAYGSGKSYMVAVLYRLFSDGYDYPALQPIWGRMKTRGWNAPLDSLEKVMKSGDKHRPWLVVPLYGADGSTLENALLKKLIDQLQINGFDPKKIMGTTWYEAAASRFEEMLIHKEYKPSLDAEFSTAEDLLRALREDADDTAFAELEAWHKKITLGLELRNNLVKEGLSNVEEAYEKAASKILAYGYQGILILWDEFGFALEELLRGHKSGSRDLGKEIMALQRFLEKNCESESAEGGRVTFMGFTHFGMSEYGSRAGLEIADADMLKKITGRFRTPDIRISLEIAESEGYHLLAGMISKSKMGNDLMAAEYPKWNRLAHMMPELELWKSFDKKTVLRDIVKPSYPLHPATASILLRLSDYIAQVNRTAFYYMTDKRTGLFAHLREKEMPDREDIGSTELIRPHELFMFFEDALKENERSLYGDYLEAERKLLDGDEEAVNLLRYVLILSAARVKVTSDMLCFCLKDVDKEDLAADSVKSAFGRCLNAKALSKNDHTDIWSFGVPGIDVEEIINQEMDDIVVRDTASFIREDNRIKEELAEFLGIFDLAPAESGIIRKVKVEVLDLSKGYTDTLPIINPSADIPCKEWCTAALYLIVPGNDKMVKKWREIIAGHEPSESYFLLPDRAVEIEGDIKRFKAVMNILDSGGLDSERQEIFESEFSHLRMSLRDEFAKYFGSKGFGEGTEVLKAGKVGTVFSAINWYDLFENISEQVHSQCHHEIKVRCPLFNEWQKSTTGSLKKIIEKILLFDQSPDSRTKFLGLSERSLEAAVSDGVLCENDILARDIQSEWNLKDYGSRNAERPEVIEIIHKYFLTGGSKKNARKLYVTLIEPPYGIPNGVIPILVALTIRKDLDRLTFFNKNGNPVAHSSIPEELAKIVLKPDTCSFRCENLTGPRRYVFRALACIIEQPIIQRETAGALFNEKCKGIVAKLREWASAFPDMVTSLESLNTEEKNFISQLRNLIPPDTRTLSDLALEMFGIDEIVKLELDNADIKTCEFPETERFWGRLNANIRYQIDESRSVVKEDLRSVSPSVISAIGSDCCHKDVDVFTSDLVGKPTTSLKKEDYLYAQGHLDGIKKISESNSGISVVSSSGIDQLNAFEHDQAEEELFTIFNKLRDDFDLSDHQLAYLCWKSIYDSESTMNDISEDD